MSFFNLKKKDDFVDLGEKYKKQQEKVRNLKEEVKEESRTEVSSPGVFGMFGASQANTEISSTDASDEKKKKLAKRLMDMTNKIEDLSNQVFQLQNRVEELEKN
ncbi:MAG: hypothetical protein OQK82_04490 [Candidatus Pacearchaeota archaeon]|nr:hypothetical protein [Candidatus Pacearchaeota archaeon]